MSTIERADTNTAAISCYSCNRSTHFPSPQSPTVSSSNDVFRCITELFEFIQISVFGNFCEIGSVHYVKMKQNATFAGMVAQSRPRERVCRWCSGYYISPGRLECARSGEQFPWLRHWVNYCHVYDASLSVFVVIWFNLCLPASVINTY